MKKNILMVGMVLLLFATVIWLLLNQQGTALSLKNSAVENKNTHFAYFMQSDFYSGILKPDKIEPQLEKIYGGIVSHHFYMEREISRFFSQLALQNPAVIVIIGPNHFNAGNADIQISTYAYQTPWGELPPDKDIINRLLALGLAKNEESSFEREHSISTLSGFVKYQFPHATLVPIILKRNTPDQEVNALAQGLNKVLSGNDMVIASVDFSHHVTNKIAQKQDKETLEQLMNFDYAEIEKRTSEEMDSPPSINVLLKYLEQRGAKIMSYTNTNQALVSGNLDNPDVTSYFFATFTGH